MAIDSSIYNALGRGIKTVRDWEAEDEQRAGAAQSRELNALTIQGARDTAEQNALARRRTGEVQGALMALGPQAKPEQVAGVYSQYGMTDQADKVLTGASTRAKAGSEVLNAGLQRGREMLQFVNTPQAAKRWWQAQYADPVVGPYLQQLGPLEEQFADIPGDPEKFGQWRQAASMLPEKFQELIAKQQDTMREQGNKDREFGLKRANELMIPGPNGGYMINQPLLDAKKQVGASSASTTNINTGQKGLDNELKVRGDFRQEPVYKAHQEMQSAHSQIQQSLKQASPAGDLAAATKMMKLLDPGSVVRESELGMAMAATGLLDRIQAFVPNIINGTKLTPDQRKQFQSLADALYGESVGQFNAKRGEYADLGGAYGMNTDRLLGPKATAGKPATSGKPKPAGAITDLGGGFSLKN